MLDMQCELSGSANSLYIHDGIARTSAIHYRTDHKEQLRPCDQSSTTSSTDYNNLASIFPSFTTTAYPSSQFVRTGKSTLSPHNPLTACF
jgi:hypothetical protein